MTDPPGPSPHAEEFTNLGLPLPTLTSYETIQRAPLILDDPRPCEVLMMTLGATTLSVSRYDDEDTWAVDYRSDNGIPAFSHGVGDRTATKPVVARESFLARWIDHAATTARSQGAAAIAQ